jgi:ribonuclease P protein component
VGPAPRPSLAFPKSARLLRRSEFLALRKDGMLRAFGATPVAGQTGFAEGPLAASWRPREPLPTRAGIAPAVARVGITVSSKVGNAVVRNRVKRRIREAVRREIGSLPAIDLVLVARAGACAAGVDELRAWVRRAARRMGGGSAA